MVQIPNELIGIKPFAVLVGIYSAVWITLEGKLWQAVLMGVMVTILSLGHLFQHFYGGKRISTTRLLVSMSIFGIFAGAGAGLFTVIFMTIKTGLHAHGPEFSLEEIHWVTGQILFWMIAGLLGGLGTGLLLKAIFDG